MAYLNSDFEGGETVFYFDDNSGYKPTAEPMSVVGDPLTERKRIPLSIKPEMGMVLIFNQNILHEGATVTSGLKYFIRTDVQYKKITSTKNDTLTLAQQSALELYCEAVELDNAKRNDEAIVFYRKATKLCDDVEGLYYSMYG
jgi:hypothetical protein